MRHNRVQARQAHAVPATVFRPRTPFAPELYASPQIVTDYESEEDHSLPGATAQNLFRPEQLYQCRFCTTQVFESDVASHTCPGRITENGNIEDRPEGRDHSDAQPEA